MHTTTRNRRTAELTLKEVALNKGTQQKQEEAREVETWFPPQKGDKPKKALRNCSPAEDRPGLLKVYTFSSGAKLPQRKPQRVCKYSVQ